MTNEEGHLSLVASCLSEAVGTTNTDNVNNGLVDLNAITIIEIHQGHIQNKPQTHLWASVSKEHTHLDTTM